LPEENILFLAGNTSALGEIFPDQERKIPGNPEIPELFLAGKSLISGIPHSPGGEGSLIYLFNIERTIKG
jgi:hypothetical protein